MAFSAEPSGGILDALVSEKFVPSFCQEKGKIFKKLSPILHITPVSYIPCDPISLIVMVSDTKNTIQDSWH